MFEEEPTHYNYQLTTQPSPPRPLPLPPTPLPLPPTPPVLPILSPLPISPQILHNVETITQVLHNVETDTTESSTQQDQQDQNIQNIQDFTQILHNEQEQDRQNRQEQLQNLFLHYPNIETLLPNLTETEQFNSEQNYQFYPEQNYSIQTGIQPPNVEVNETQQEIMETISYVVNSQEIGLPRTGKDISLLKKHHEEEKEEEEEEEEKEELRTTTKNNKRFHKYLILKKKDEILKKFPILSQKNTNLVVTAENKFKELKSIFVLKKIYIEKNKELKEHIYGLELIEHRYRCETDRLDKKEKKRKIKFFFKK